MGNFFPSPPLFSAFLFASLVLAIAPGPGVLYIVSRSLAEGRRSGIASVAGVALGNLGNVVAASLGLAAIFSLSSFAFNLVRYAGAAYLIYLGTRLFRSPQTEFHAVESTPAALRRIFRDGFFVALFNPKTAVFFAAFLPQFVSPSASPGLQTIALGAMFVAIAAFTDSAYALAAGTLAPRLRRAPKLGRYISGGMFIGLGIFTALVGSRGGNA